MTNSLRNFPRRSQAGYTLVEVIVAAGIAAFAVTAAFAFARYQMSSIRTQTEVGKMNASSALIFQQLRRDLDSAGFGTSFWVGAPNTAFSGQANEVTFANYGVPSIRPTNNIGVNGTELIDPMPGTDIITLIRYESDSTSIPLNAAGETHVPAAIPNLALGFTMANPRKLSCANRDIDGDNISDGLLLFSNMSSGTVGSFLLGVNPISLVDTTVGVPGNIFIANTFGLDPQNPAARNSNVVPPSGAGPGSQVICVRPVAYWVDRGARLRLWRAGSAFPAGNDAISPSAGDTDFVARIDPQRDIVVAEGVEDLQFAYFTNTEATNPAQWIYGDPALGQAGTQFGGPQQLAEMRQVRVSAILRTPRADQEFRPNNRPANLEDRALPQNAEAGCQDPLSCYDNRYFRRTVRFTSDLKNLRFFDLMADPNLASANIRSYIP
ncbi:MAG: prepilin-type N-terminal cleavage/methylation domain-containing protein [Myxococcota bacterium]|nr:prepilin-type N-terminal cleavage/methylation domain-containing protein [Myxococcota bacterium]